MKSKSRQVAMGGVFVALTVLALLAVSYIPNSKLFFYGLSSLFVSFVVVDLGIRAGWIFYLASSLLSLLLVANKLLVIPYLAFFGLYGLVKYYLESMKKPMLEYLLKGCFCAISQAALYLVFTRLFAQNIESQIPIYYLFFILLITFFVYDYLYTRFLSFYIYSFRKKSG